MPIQVVATFRKIPPPPVDLVTAGNDVFPLCDTVVTLTAEVDPIENLQGHSIIWEQLSGLVVTLINPTQLVASYTQITNDVTDKEFRITIDKNLKDEQTDTVVVYATPTSLPISSISSDSWHGSPSDAVIDLAVDTGAAIPDPQNVRNSDVVVAPLFTINWSAPPDVTLQPFVTEYELFEDQTLSYNFTQVATINSADPLEYAGGPYQYYVVAKFVVNGVDPFQSSSEKSRVENFENIVVPLTAALDEMTAFGFVSPQSTIVKFLNIVQHSVDISNMSPAFADSVIVQYGINIVREDEDTVHSSLAETEKVITRLDPGGIGGG